ncbi:hypothetical protein Murmansk-017 [Murmansk poxvirus]|uniref:Ankyrin repeat protein n=1 Tax=Murmansk poxvirus TaxID=2025359 RepID=A0A223FMK1_9POXV|nr:hypothetical protein CKM52_gp017 [Murmansk poxvirus]AST09212.1 hypothetical protein Murmansk-017 [Murmansk poxvirus]
MEEDFILSYLEHQYDVKLHTVKKILDNCIDPNIVDRFNNNAIHCYCYNKKEDIDINVINLLIRYGVDILHRNNNNLTPLGEYVKHHHNNIKNNIVNILLHHSNTYDIDIGEYIKSDDIDIGILKKLIENNYVNTPCYMNDIVDNYTKCKNIRYDVLKLLLDNSNYYIDEDICDSYLVSYEHYSRNAFHNYIMTNIDLPLSKDIINLMKKYIHTSSMDNYGYLPIQYYWKNSVVDIKIVKLLIDNINCSITYKDKIQPLMRGVLADYINAKFRGKNYHVDMKIIDLLLRTDKVIDMALDNKLENFISYDFKDFICSITSYDSRHYNYDLINKIISRFDKIFVQEMLYSYLYYSDSVCIDIIKIILDNGAIINTNAVYMYFENSYNVINPDVVKFMMENNGHLAVNTNNKQLLIYLLLTSRFNTLKHYENILLDVISVMLKYIKDINMKDSRGLTALYYSVANKYKKVTKLLLENGANVNAVMDKGNTIISKAITRIGDVKLTNMLLSYRPTLECMLATVSSNCFDPKNKSLLAFVKYGILLDINFPCNHLNVYKKEIDSYIDDINKMKNIKIAGGVSVFDILINKNLLTRLNYVNNPILIDFINNSNSIYKDEIKMLLNDTIIKRNYIDIIINSIDDYILPVEIVYKILSYSVI